MERIQVWENEPVPFSLLGNEDVLFLANKLGGNFSFDSEKFTIKRIIGSIELPSTRILAINSKKAPTLALLNWLAFVDPTLNSLRDLNLTPEQSDSGDIFSILAMLFVTELSRAVSLAGIAKNYSIKSTEDANIRGAIDFNRLYKSGGSFTKTPCLAWNRTTDHTLNQIFLLTIWTIQKNTYARIFCGHKFQSLQALFNCGEILPAKHFAISKYNLSKSEIPFQKAFALAKMILSSSFLGQGAAHSGLCFILNLETLFEKTVGIALKKFNESAMCKHSISYYCIDEENRQSERTMELDGFIPSGLGKDLVVDAKFKSKIDSSNIQQLVTYCVAKGSDKALFVMPELDSLKENILIFPFGGDYANKLESIKIFTIGFSTNAKTFEEWESTIHNFCSALAEILE